MPPQWYLEFYRDTEIPPPYHGTWETSKDTMPGWMNNRLIQTDHMTEKQIEFARRAFYALCTHIDHQIRVVLGTIREAGLLDNTIIMFLADHGDMLGNHGLFAKRMFYEDSACVPMLLVGTKGDQRLEPNSTDNRLVGLQDCMPTLLDLCDLDIPETVDGRSMITGNARKHLYGEYGEGFETTRMIHNGRFKLIYYAAGNRLQLFDLETDPLELTDLSESPEHQVIRANLTDTLLSEFYGADTELVANGQLRGLPNPSTEWPDRNLSLQRGTHWPVPPQS